MTGRRILDAGCGSGPLFAALRERGAVMTGIDKSAGILEVARRRLGADADLRAGFRISVISEPQPVPAARELFPDEFRLLTTSPSFLFFLLHAE